MRFSILICTLGKRAELLERLHSILRPQVNGDIEILVESDDGELSIGAKRNKLLERAQGDYVAFVDDDDRVADDYVARILQALQANPDCVGFEGRMTTNGRDPRKFIHSYRYESWFEQRRVYYRMPNHLNPIKREFALKVRFPEISHGEDHDYSIRLRPLLANEIYLNNPPIYFYDYVSAK